MQQHYRFRAKGRHQRYLAQIVILQRMFQHGSRRMVAIARVQRRHIHRIISHPVPRHDLQPMRPSYRRRRQRLGADHNGIGLLQKRLIRSLTDLFDMIERDAPGLFEQRKA